MTPIPILAVLLAAVAVPALAQQQSPPGSPSARMPYFQGMDTNSDGAVSREEFLAGHRGQQYFGAYDLDKDGAVSRQEFEAAGQQRRAQRFAQMDANKDGRLTADEVEGQAQTMFDAMDQNGDGRITQDEMPMRGGHGRGYGPGMMQQQGQRP
jgi:hypothetical protein